MRYYKLSLSFTFVICLAPEVSAQRLYFGVVGGTALTSDFPTTDYTTPADSFGNPASRFQFLTGPRSFIFGAQVEGRISDAFSIEVNALLRPMKDTIIFTEFPANGSTSVSRNTYTGVRAWEFPVLVKYSLPFAESARRVHPFLEAGPAFRTQDRATATQPSQFGVSAGVGAAVQLGKIRIAPTIRYTRWDPENIAPKYATKADQIEFLTSIAYQTDAASRHLAGRRLQIGAVAGLPLSSGFSTSANGGGAVERVDYLAGLTAELNLAGSLSVEADAIYKPLRAGSDAPDVQTRFSVLTWQFPLLAKYRWARTRWTPFAEAGPSFRAAGNLNGYNPSHYGITAGAGVETRAHGIRLAPAIRYTHWALDPYPFYLPPGVHFHQPQTDANAVEAVFGVSF